MFLFRTATRQICRRLGYFATFMCRPALKGYYSSGWHLHQSLTEASTGRNLFTPQAAGEILSPLGQAYLAGLLHYAAPATVFATPTVNGYRRFRPNSLAPDRATWAYDHRGAMIRVLGGVERPGHPAGEPRSASPQPIRISTFFRRSSRDWPGSSADRPLPPPNDEPYAAERPILPKSLPEALDALDREPLFRHTLGNTFVDYFVKLKRSEAGRYAAVAERSRSRAKRRAERMGAERIF